MRYVHQYHRASSSRTCPEPVERVTDDTGAAVDEASYDPWGNVSASTGTADTDRLYTGQRFDAATGLYYYNARYGACPERSRRDPTLARFISPDTIVPGVADPQAWNRYAYVLGNPLRYVDPSGNEHRLGEETALTLTVVGIMHALLSGNTDLFNQLSAIRQSHAKLSREIAFEHRQQKMVRGGVLRELTGDALRERVATLRTGTVLLVSENETAITLTGGDTVHVSAPGVSVDVTVYHDWLARLFKSAICPGSDACTPTPDGIYSDASLDGMTIRLLVHETTHTVQTNQFDNPDYWILEYLQDPAVWEDPAYAAQRRTSLWVVEPGN